jgi:predicted CoA-substrate-specific enzyme activase
MRDRSIVKEMLFDTVDFYRSFGARDGAVFRVDIAGWGLAPDRIVATGYGRENISFAEGAVMPEIQAHAAGAVFLAGLRSCVLIDIGGQDVKVIKVADGQVVHFAVNDKCAAGTGRYLEHMSRVLGIGIDELGMSADDPVILSSTCAVFSETELTGKIAAGIPVRRLAAGVNYSAFMKLKPLLLKVWRGEPVILTGGGAKNKSFSHFLRKEIGCEIIEIARPQFAGAVGCSLAGLSEAAV